MSAPREVAKVSNVTESDVVVELVTWPTAPLLKVTVLLPAVVEKPVPAMVRVVELCTRLVVLEVIERVLTVAT